MMSWDNLWEKDFTHYSRPTGVSDEDWKKIIIDVTSAPSSLSRGDKELLRQLKRQNF